MGDAESGWTIDTLHAHIDKQIADFAKLLDERYTAIKKADDKLKEYVDLAVDTADKNIVKAERSIDDRLKTMNRLREQLETQADSMVPRTEMMVFLAAMNDKFKGYEERFNAHVLSSDKEKAELRSRLDRIAGSSLGEDEHKMDINRIYTVFLAALAVAVAIYAVIKS